MCVCMGGGGGLHQSVRHTGGRPRYGHIHLTYLCGHQASVCNSFASLAPADLLRSLYTKCPRVKSRYSPHSLHMYRYLPQTLRYSDSLSGVDKDSIRSFCRKRCKWGMNRTISATASIRVLRTRGDMRRYT